ncbi:MAG: cupredoxin domain-containing protein [Actinomycetota bacterium]|nr:cupredoxin domain-containing protein [Actinomycetota bacterium]
MSDDGSRENLLLPIAIPLGILIVIALVLVGFSRVLLSIKSHHAATSIALIVAATILGLATFLAGRPRVTGSLLFSMVAAVAGVAMVAGGIAVAAIGPPKEPAVAEPPQKVTIDASNSAAVNGFDQKTLTWQADAPVDLTFDNKDVTAHNFYVAASKDAAGSPLFSGTTVNGGVQFTYKLQPLAAGDYYFFCNIHPATMNGTLTVTAAVAGGGSNEISAQALAFSTDKLQLPAGPTELTFDNKDTPGTQHNVGIFSDAAFGTEVFKGDLISAPSSTTYHVNLQPGTYYFRCDIHVTMKGTLVVTGPPPGGRSTSATPSASP